MELAVIVGLAIALVIAGLALRGAHNDLAKVEEELPGHVERALIAGFQHGVKYALTGKKPRHATLLKSYQAASTSPRDPREVLPQ